MTEIEIEIELENRDNLKKKKKKRKRAKTKPSLINRVLKDNERKMFRSRKNFRIFSEINGRVTLNVWRLAES